MRSLAVCLSPQLCSDAPFLASLVQFAAFCLRLRPLRTRKSSWGLTRGMAAANISLYGFSPRQSSCSVFMRARDSAGPAGAACAPVAARASAKAGSRTTASVASERRCNTVVGVPLGARTPSHPELVNFGKPCSAKVRTSGRSLPSATKRTPIMRSLPPLTCALRMRKPPSALRSPPRAIAAVTAGAPPW